MPDELKTEGFDLDDGCLTYQEAYTATFGFLESYCKRSPELPLVTLLSGMPFLEDGNTADPAALHDWKQAIDKQKKGHINTSFR